MIRFVPSEPGDGPPSHLRAGPADAETLYLLVHGFPDSARVWEPMMEALPDSALRIAPFAPGTDGVPPRSRREFSLKTRRDRILRLVDSLGDAAARRVVVVGHDLGGGLVEPLREGLGERAVAAVYVNSLTLHQFWKRKSRLSQLWRSLYVVAFQCPLLNRRTLSPVADAFRKRVYDLGGLAPDDPLRTESPDVLWGIESYRAYLPDFLRLVGRPIRRSPTPTLYLHGVDDPYILVPTEGELLRFFENAKLVTLDAGHWPQRGHADELAKHLVEFVSLGPTAPPGPPRARSARA